MRFLSGLNPMETILAVMGILGGIGALVQILDYIESRPKLRRGLLKATTWSLALIAGAAVFYLASDPPNLPEKPAARAAALAAAAVPAAKPRASVRWIVVVPNVGTRSQCSPLPEAARRWAGGLRDDDTVCLISHADTGAVVPKTMENITGAKARAELPEFIRKHLFPQLHGSRAAGRAKAANYLVASRSDRESLVVELDPDDAKGYVELDAPPRAAPAIAGH